MSKARELASLGNAYSDGALSNRNLIINGAMQVWQRGTSFNGAGYTADRWFQASNNTNAITQSSVTLPNGDAANTLKVTATGSASEWFDIYQVVEDYKRLLGKTVTMSGWVRTNINGVVFRKYSDQNLSSVVPNDGAWHYIEATFTPDVSGGAVRGPTGSTFGVTFNAPLSVVSGDYYEFAQVQLEVGDTATPFEHRSYGQELALAQRFFERFYYPSGQNRPVALGHWYATNGVHAPFYYSEKRAAPTASVSNANHFGLYIGTSLDANYATTLNLVQLTSRCLNFNPSAIATGAVGTVNAAALISKMALYDAWIDIDAEL